MDEYKNCASCKTRTITTDFTTKKGIILKSCNRCLTRQNENRKRLKCEHGHKRSVCKECGGSGFCEHGRRRSRCKECGGSDFCEHDRRRSRCKECGGSEICEHERRRSRCKDCEGTEICEHERQRFQCKECSDPVHITIRNWINNSKHSDINSDRYIEQEYITYEFCQKIMKESNFQCCYCACELQMMERKQDLITIERIDNSKGHIIGNCKIACFRCNSSRVGQ